MFYNDDTTEIDIDSLRSDLLDYFGTAAFSVVVVKLREVIGAAKNFCFETCISVTASGACPRRLQWRTSCEWKTPTRTSLLRSHRSVGSI